MAVCPAAGVGKAVGATVAVGPAGAEVAGTSVAPGADVAWAAVGAAVVAAGPQAARIVAPAPSPAILRKSRRPMRDLWAQLRLVVIVSSSIGNSTDSSCRSAAGPGNRHLCAALALGRGFRGRVAFLPLSLLLLLPVKAARRRPRLARGAKRQDIRPSWAIGVVRSGVVQRTAVVHRGAAGWDGARGAAGRARLRVVHFQSNDAWIVANRMMRQHLLPVCARHKLH